MVVNSWSDHRGNWRDAGFSNDAPPKISKPCHRVTVVGAERSIQLSYDRTSYLVFPQVGTYIVYQILRENANAFFVGSKIFLRGIFRNISLAGCRRGQGVKKAPRRGIRRQGKSPRAVCRPPLQPNPAPTPPGMLMRQNISTVGASPRPAECPGMGYSAKGRGAARKCRNKDETVRAAYRPPLRPNHASCHRPERWGGRVSPGRPDHNHTSRPSPEHRRGRAWPTKPKHRIPGLFCLEFLWFFLCKERTRQQRKNKTAKKEPRSPAALHKFPTFGILWVGAFLPALIEVFCL